VSNEKKQWKCLGECGREFGYGEWECFPGVAHRVAPKTYYKDDAPHCDPVLDPDGLALRSARTHCHIVPDVQVKDADSGQTVTQHHPPVLFVMGSYTTDNPKEQFFIERAKIDVGYDRWFAVYHTPKQKQNLKDGEQKARAADLDRREKEVNELLEKVKKDSAKKVVA
jgi:hypothetical protein